MRREIVCTHGTLLGAAFGPFYRLTPKRRTTLSLSLSLSHHEVLFLSYFMHTPVR